MISDQALRLGGFSDDALLNILADVNEDKAKLGDQSIAMQNMFDDMYSEKKAVNDQRMAIFNILDDVNQAQEELLLSNKSLEKRKFELQALKSLSDELTGTLDILAAIDSVNKYLWEVLDYSLATYMIYDPLTGGFEFRANLKESVSEKFLLKARTELANYISAKANPDVAGAAEEMAAEKGDLKAGLSGLPFSDKGGSDYNSSFILPLTVGENILGALHISSTKLNLYQNPAEREIVDAMVATVSVSISRLQTLIQSQHSRTESLVESLSNGVTMFDAQKKVILANPMAAKFTGLSKEGYYLEELYKLFSGVKLKEAVDLVFTSGKTAKINEANVANYVFEAFITPVRDFKGNIVGGAIILHDMTHVKEVDRMKTEFVSLASHQLRTPLTSINWYIEMLQAGDAGTLNDKQNEFLPEVYKGSKRMVQLVNDLLNVSRLETGRLKIEPVPTDLTAFIQGIRKEVEPQVVDTGCHISLEFPEKKVNKVNVDKILLRQVIVNLLTNAIHYSAVGKNGRVGVSLAVGPQAYTISVKDNGIGIPKDVQDHIFEKFFRADNARTVVADGNGLGLYLVKQIMDSSGGTIGFTSKLGKGTTFYVTIPLSGMNPKQGEKGLEG